MLTLLLGLGWTVLMLVAGGALGYRWGYSDGWTDAGKQGFDRIVDGGWPGGGRRGE